MSKYTIDEQGKWLIQGNARLLVEPSDSYLAARQAEEQTKLEEELFNNLLPSEKEILMAEIELNIINLLLEMEVF